MRAAVSGRAGPGCAVRKKRGITCSIFGFSDTLQRFQEKQLSFSQFFARCGLFTVMWIVTNLLLVFGLRLLDTTDVLALYSAHVAFVYLLSWVILHQQFVGVRVSVVIRIRGATALFNRVACLCVSRVRSLPSLLAPLCRRYRCHPDP